MKSQPTLFQTIRQEIAKEKKLLRRKKCMLKFKVFLCLILPVFIVLLTVKVIKTYLQIKLKNAVIPGLKKKMVPKPLKKEPAGEEIVAPQPVSEPYQPIRIQPVVMESAATEPVTTEPAKTDSVLIKPAKTDSVLIKPATTESATIETVSIVPTEFEPVKITTDDCI